MGLLLFLLVARPNIKAPFRTCMNFMLYLTWSNQSALIQDWVFLGIQRSLRQLLVILLLLQQRLILAFVVLPKRDLVLSWAGFGGTLGRNSKEGTFYSSLNQNCSYNSYHIMNVENFLCNPKGCWEASLNQLPQQQ